MPGFEHGLQRIVGESICGLITYIIVKTIFLSIGIPIILFNLLSIIAIIELFDKMMFWSTTYLLGWICGLFLVHRLIGWEFLLYFIVGIFYLVLKIYRKVT